MDFQSSEAVLVLADELEERGDARAELVRAQLQGREHAELLRANWRQWVGGLDPQSALLRWKWGHLVEVGVRAAKAGWTPEDLLTKPTTQFLARLALGPKVPSRGLEHAQGLRHLICFGSLESNALPTVETLSMDLDGAGAERLPALVAPRLVALHTRVAPKDEALLLKSLARAPWFAGLQTWTHRLAATESLAALLANGPLLERGGAGCQFLCDEPVLKAITDDFRRALPRAQFALLSTPNKQPHDPENFEGPMVTSVVPSRAPMDFRSRRAMERTVSHGIQSDEPEEISIGSGFPLGKYEFSTCSWCGNSNVLGIWMHTWSLYAESETTRYADWEYECHDCGLFTAMRSGHTT